MGRKFSVYIKDDELVKWINTQVEGGRFRNCSHLFEEAAKILRKKIESRWIDV